MKEIKFENILKLSDEIKERVRQWRNKDEIRKYMLDQHIITKEEHFNWIKGLAQRNNWRFWLVFIDDTPIGSVYLQNIDYDKLTSEWGFYIGEDTYRGKGLSKYILFKLLEYYFEEMKFDVLFTKLFSYNVVALNLYKKFKFVEMDKIAFENQNEIIILKFSKRDWTKWKEMLKKRILL